MNIYIYHIHCWVPSTQWHKYINASLNSVATSYHNSLLSPESLIQPCSLDYWMKHNSMNLFHYSEECIQCLSIETYVCCFTSILLLARESSTKIVLFQSSRFQLYLYSQHSLEHWAIQQDHCRKLGKLFTGPSYKLLLSFAILSYVHMSYIPNETTFTKYCLSQWISKLPRRFEIHWVRQYLVNLTGLVGIFTRLSQFSQVSGMAKYPDF